MPADAMGGNGRALATTAGKGDQNVMVFRVWGADEPGIAEAFMKVVVDHKCQVLDLAQFVLDGSLMFTFVLRVGDQSSMGLMKELTRSAKEHQLQLDFYFPDSCHLEGARPGGELVAVVSVVSPKEITPALLCGLDSVLNEHGCVVKEIEHRCDNKKEINGEYNKVEIRVSCPPRLKLATLAVGAPTANGESSTGLQKVAWEHGAEMTIRWWDAMNRPNGKSLVVFGLSNELCTCRVLDEVLKEAGLDPGSVPAEGSIEKQNELKVAMLKGKSTQVVQKVIDRLEFTPGARLVCSALKRLGFRLAILTNVGVKKIAEHVKRELGMDYVMSRDAEVVDGLFTGKYTGELTDVRFRKADLLMLMAEREGIDYRNVILIGEEVTHLNAAKAREVVETFGPNVYFNSTKLKDLTIALYLLGFNGSDVRALRKRRRDEVSDGAVASNAPAGKRFRVQVSAKRRDPGQLQRMLTPLSSFRPEMRISTVSQCSLQDGGMCVGFDLWVQKQEPDQLLKELLFACQKQDFQVLGSSLASPSATDAAAVAALGGGRQLDLAAAAPGRSHYVITLVQKPQITAASLSAIFGLLRARSVNLVRIERLSVHDLAALQFTVELPEELETGSFSNELMEASNSHGIDIAFQKDDLDRWMRRLVVFDMDSTLIQQEVIDELAKFAGVEDEVKKLTEAAMRGELNFFESLKSRVALLKGHNADELFSKVKKNLIFTPGAKKLCSTLRRLGYKMAVISGGFLPVAREVQQYLGLDYAFANTLEVDETTGLLTGQTSGPVVTPQRKRALLATIADVEGCELQQTIAVGDGANDIPMLNAAGLGIAFCAKPKVQAVTEFRINQKDLSTVLFLIGVSEHAAERLAADDKGKANA